MHAARQSAARQSAARQSAARESAAHQSAVWQDAARQNAASRTAPQQPPTQSAPPRTARRSVSAPPAGATRGSGGRASAKVSQTAAASRPKEPLAVQNAFIRSGDAVRVRGGVDRPMLVIILVLIGYGLVMAYSASYPYALARTDDSNYFIMRQIIAVAIGLGGMTVLSLFDYKSYYKLIIPGMIVTAGLLVVVALVGTSISDGGAQRWIYIGPISFQPSEFMKVMIILFLAMYMERFGKQVIDYRDKKTSFVYGALFPFGALVLVCFLIILEKHVSGTAIIFVIGLSIIFCGGCELIWILMGGAAGITAIVGVITFSEYARERVDIWLHPENYSSLDEVWQTLQGLNAVGSGGIFGVGFGNGRQKHMYVSQAQNDFIFAIICEELGLIGAASVILLFILFIWRGFHIAVKAPDTFSALTALGITVHIGMQACLNMLVVTNMFPNTGIALPFFSCGGTSTMIMIAEMGILLSVSRFTYEYEKKPPASEASENG